MPGMEIIAIPPGSDLVHAAAGPDVAWLAAEAAAFADAATAPATRRAYNSAWRGFCTWCDSHNASLPASAETVAAYLANRANDGLKVSTLSLHRAAIDAAYRAEGWEIPDSPFLRATWAGIRNRMGAPPLRKRAISVADIRRIVKRLPSSNAGRRDQALLLITFAAALRRNEAAAMAIDAPGETRPVRLRFVAEGAEVLIDRSKGDQQGSGAVVAVPYGRNPASCPIQALRRWLAGAQITGGAVFRSVDRFDRVGAAPINGRTVARIVKAHAASVGLDPAAFSGHSLRRGLITAAAKAGANHESIQRHARHARWDTTRGYIEEANRFRDNAAGKVGL